MSKLFPRPSTCRVMIGPAGSGKTSLCVLMTKTWADTPNSFSTNYDLVFYLDLAQCHQTGIIESIYSQILPDDFRISRTNFMAAMEEHSKRILFLLDGFGNTALNDDIGKILERNLFYGCSVLLFTSPCFVSTITFTVESFVHCTGLKEINIARCVKTFTNLVDIEDKPLNKFLENLRSNQAALQTFRNPITCLSLASSYDGSLPILDKFSSMTIMLAYFLESLMVKFYKENGLMTSGGKVLEIMKKTTELLEKQAYEHVLNGHMVLTAPEMDQFEVEGFQNLGIFCQVGSNWSYQCSLWRDFLAAQYLSRMEDNDFLREIYKKELLKLPKYEQMVEFLCGLEGMGQTSTKLNKIANEFNSQNRRQVRRLSFINNPLNGASEGSKLKESGKLSQFVPSLNALSESGNNTHFCETLSKSLPRSILIKSQHLFSGRTLLGLSSVLQQQPLTIEELDISLGRLHEFQSYTLLQLAQAIGQSKNVGTLKVSYLSINIAGRFLGAALENNTSLKHVTVDTEKGHLSSMPTNNNAAMWAGLQVASEHLRYVNTFNFLNCPYPRVVAHVIRHLPPTLPDLNISGCAFDMVCGGNLASVLEHTTQLKSLNISEVHMGNSEFTAFVQGLKVCRTLQEMKVANTKMGRPAFLALCESLLLAKSIESLDLRGCHLTTEMGSRLAQITEKVATLKSLNLLNSDITDEGRSLIQLYSPRSLKVNGIEKSRGLPPILGGHGVQAL